MFNIILPETLALIKRWESFVPGAYLDTGGGLAIGYGHGAIAPPKVTADMVWTEEQASAQLLSDLELVGHWLAPKLDIVLNDYQYGALLSMCYNKGVGAVTRSDFFAKMHAHDEKNHMEQAANMMLDFGTWAEDKITHQRRFFLGLRCRRIAEAALFLREPS